MPITRSLQEVVFAVHFAAPLPLTLLDVADWIAEYGGEQPVVQELPVLGRSEMPIPGKVNQAALQFVQEVDGTLPRVRVRGPDPHSLCILQNDRVAFGWTRVVAVGEDVDYPGYDALRGAWALEISRFSRWLTARIGEAIVPRMVELSYANAYILDVDDKPRRMGDIFKLLNADYRPVNAFQVNWSEFIGVGGEGVVNAQAGVGVAPPAKRVFAVNYFGLAIPGGQSESGDAAEAVMLGVDKLHQRILDMHEAAVVSGA